MIANEALDPALRHQAVAQLAELCPTPADEHRKFISLLPADVVELLADMCPEEE